MKEPKLNKHAFKVISNDGEKQEVKLSVIEQISRSGDPNSDHACLIQWDGDMVFLNHSFTHQADAVMFLRMALRIAESEYWADVESEIEGGQE